MPDITTSLLLAPDTHANRPAATTANKGALYPCTTHSTLYRSNGSTWDTILTGLSTSGISAGVYKSVTENTQGIATAGTLLTGVSSENLFSQTATKTVGNTATETTLTNTGLGSLTLPANFLTVGKVLRLRAFGYLSDDGTTVNLTLRAKLGSTTLCVTPTSALPKNLSNVLWMVEVYATCYISGVTATLWADGWATVFGNGASWGAPSLAQMVTTATVTVDGTGTLLMDLLATWGGATSGDTLTCTELTLEALN